MTQCVSIVHHHKFLVIIVRTLLSIIPKISDALSKQESGIGDMLNIHVDIFGNSISDDPVYLSLTQTIKTGLGLNFHKS